MDDYKSKFPLDDHASIEPLQSFPIRLLYRKILIKHPYLIEYIKGVTLLRTYSL